MRRIRSAALLAIALAGCGGEAQRPAEEPQATPAAAAPAPAASTLAGDSAAIAEVEALAGEYRVAGADGQDIDLPHGITVTIDAETIRVNASCVNFAWTYRFDGTRFVTQTLPVTSCRRGLFPEEEAVQAAFDAAEAVARLPSNGIEFSGGGHSVVLFSQ